MPEPLSLVVATLSLGGCAALREFSSRGTGLSPDADYLAREARELVVNVERSIALTGSRSAVLSELVDLVDEHGHPGWDGAEAPAVSSLAIAKARALILALPESLPSPELAVEPDDGAISLEWYGGPSRIFSVSVGLSDRLACAGMDGTDSWHGVTRFNGCGVPDFVLQSIRRVLA
ncbi:MAG: hypothetical protein WCP35_09520 [Verrucomicrobiota bacterium]